MHLFFRNVKDNIKTEVYFIVSSYYTLLSRNLSSGFATSIYINTVKDIDRKTRILMLEVNAFKNDVYGTPQDDMGPGPSVLKDFLDKLSDLRKKS